MCYPNLSQSLHVWRSMADNLLLAVLFPNGLGTLVLPCKNSKVEPNCSKAKIATNKPA